MQAQLCTIGDIENYKNVKMEQGGTTRNHPRTKTVPKPYQGFLGVTLEHPENIVFYKVLKLLVRFWYPYQNRTKSYQ